MSDTNNDSLKESALHYHTHPVAGKMEIQPTKSLANKRDLSLAYSPGVAYACEEIVADPNYAAKVTSRGNLVAVVSNGTAVLGLGNIGPLASKPVMEGKAVLFKKFANIDVFDIEVDETDVDKLVDTIAALEPTFGGINLEDIKAPECFLVERKLRERMNIPVFHDDQHGTAIVAAAAVYNGLRIVDKKIEDIKLVVSGSGAASIACVELLISMGLSKQNLLLVDRGGVVYEGRPENMNPWKEKLAANTDARTLADAMVDCDVFMGLSGPGVLKPDMVKTMARDPLILAMANPTPEILPEEAKEVRPDAILATGRSDYPNQVNNVLCFPFIFRGALDCGASTINEEMKMACVRAIADLAMKEATDVVAEAYAGEDLKFGPDYLIPKPFDPRLVEELPVAVVQAAMDSGVATRPIEDLDAYKKSLHEFVNRAGLFMEPVIQAAKRGPKRRLVYAEGENDDVLLAVQAVVDEDVARPVILGRPEVIEDKIQRLSLRLKPGKDIDVFNPKDADNNERYWQHYHTMTGRQGVSVEGAKSLMTTNATALAAVMVSLGEAHGMICGKVGRFLSHLRDIYQVLGTKEQGQHISSVQALLLPSGPVFMTDSFLTVDPTVEEIVIKTKAAIEFVRQFGIKPKVALLSHSNFGTSNAPSAKKMRKAAAILREEFPDVELDGEMHALSALNPQNRNEAFSGSNLSGSANLLVMPNLDAANIALGLVRSFTDALLIGPFLTGLKKPAHIVIPSVTSRGIFNMTALTAVDMEHYCKDNACEV
ncbi:NADP-dependent malic enzyme [Porticoccus sp. W117]|uniref:NADP-dependent malic enzyme n=1 Tax=Porticoccus sp. W117 TaxID=3054777 RepID=UPI002599BEF1|nr:NADP-dependent malic enzyme [Porticoccus sp. W117]MDM3871631.1 NADP-dependent malic enzyme [Porticoccus sp. W117]